MTAREIAQDFHDAIVNEGWIYEIHNDIVSITLAFEPGDNDGFLRLDCDATSLLNLLPSTSLVYGTEGVGGDIALRKGYGTVKLPGVRNTVLRELTRLRETL